MTPLFLYNNISEKQWAFLVNKIPEKRLSRIHFIRDFLLELERTIWGDMYEVWNQANMTEEMWDNYKILFDKPKLVEHIQMKELEKTMKKRFVKFREELRERIVAEKEGRVVDSEYDIKVTPEELMHESQGLASS